MVSSPYRIKFTKVGMLRFISHLDLNRTMTRALIRAGLPVRYSEGFNPHPKIAFGPPLSIGTESVSEFMDFRLETEERDMPDADTVTCKMNLSLPPEMRVLETYHPVTQLSSIAFAEYEISSSQPFDPAPLYAERIILPKRTKKGTAETDIKPMIYDIGTTERTVRCILSARPESYLNPEYVARALSLSDYSITRTGMFSSGAEGAPVIFR